MGWFLLVKVRPRLPRLRPPCSSAARAKVVEQLDLPEPEDFDKVKEACEVLRVKSRGRRVPQVGLPKGDASGRFRGRSY